MNSLRSISKKLPRQGEATVAGTASQPIYFFNLIKT